MIVSTIEEVTDDLVGQWSQGGRQRVTMDAIHQERLFLLQHMVPLGQANECRFMRTSSGGNWVLETYNPVPGVMDNLPASRGYSGGFGSDLMLKDLGLALEAAIARRAPVPLGSLAESLYAALSRAGHGGLDFSSIISLLKGVRA